MTAFSLRARLHLGANSNLALSLPQSRLCILWARQLPPQREPRRLPPQGTDLALPSKFGVNAVSGRRYNPSVTPTACQLPLHRGAKIRAQLTKVRGAVKPAFGGLPSSVTVQRKSAAPRHLPPRGRRGRPLPLCVPAIKMCRDPRHTSVFHAPEGCASCARRARFIPQRGASFAALRAAYIPQPQTSARCMAPRSLFRRQS